MDAKILEFIEALRSAGIRITVSEGLDCFRALTILPLSDKPTFKSVLRSTLVKRGNDLPTFEKLFELFFTSLAEPLQPPSESEEESGGFPFASNDTQEFIDQFLAQHSEEFPMLNSLLNWQLDGDFRAVMMQQGIATGLSEISNPLQVGFFSKKIRDSLGWNLLGDEIEKLSEALTGAGYSPDEIGELRDYIERRMKKIFETIKAFVRREFERNNSLEFERMKEDELLDKSFYRLSRRELEMMRDLVARLGRKMKDKQVIRTKHKRRGRIDVKRVIRRNMRYGGIPVELSFKDRRREKPNIFALCDISDSVSYASRFMLQFLYTLQELFTKVRTFVFVTEIAEVTRLFTEHEINAAIEMALSSRYVDYNGHSNFGYAFHRFQNEFLESVTPRTTIIVMGDARNNRNDPRTWAFKEISEKAKRVIWLNPESRNGWRLGDSVMYEYMPYCDETHECRNARQLMRVIDRVVSK